MGAGPGVLGGVAPGRRDKEALLWLGVPEMVCRVASMITSLRNSGQEALRALRHRGICL